MLKKYEGKIELANGKGDREQEGMT